MPRKHYDWANGPAIIEPHSIAKHTILQTYLAAYFQTLASNPRRKEFRLTLVDGFAGGGLYSHTQTHEQIHGSPLICLKAVEEAEFKINQNRRIPLKLDVSFLFIEAERSAYTHLMQVLRNEGYDSRIGKDVYVRHKKFQEDAADIIQYIKNKSPNNGRSIFILDQYGYKEVPTTLIAEIFSNLPSAEVILTFAVDSLLNYLSEKNSTRKYIDEIGLPDFLHGKSISEIKTDGEWRLLIQSGLYRKLISQCGARHFTPFFIRNKKGHGDYWLIHMSQHHRARDVMTQVHWQHNNYFIHYGGSGLQMFHLLGYDPDKDFKQAGQLECIGFEFDDFAKETSISSLMKDIPRLVYAHDEGIRFGELFSSTCNESPASEDIYRLAIERLIQEAVIEVKSIDGGKRLSGRQIEATDQLMAPRQRPFIFL